MNTHKLNISNSAVGDYQLPYSVLNSETTVKVNDKEYIVVKKTRGNKIEAGVTYLVEFSNGESGYSVETCNGYVAGFTDDKEDVIWSTVKQIYDTHNVKSLKALDEKVEYDQSPHMNVTSLSSNRTGSYYYIYNGRWVWGSSCDSLAFYELKEYNETEHNAQLEAEAEADHDRATKRTIENKKSQMARLQDEIDYLEATMNRR